MNFLRIVLVKSKYPRNVGMVSRIMCNFGIDNLILIDPQCEMSEEARQGAAQGQAPLRNVTIYKDWPEFIAREPEGPRIALSRRQGKRRPSSPLPEIFAWEGLHVHRPRYLIFGAEDHGLNSEDLEYIHRVCHFDIPGDLKSMNLSHAVLVAVQEFYNHFKDHTQKLELTEEPIALPKNALKLWLEALDFDLDSQNRWNALTMLNQLIMKAGPTPQEVHQLEMIIQHTLRKMSSKHATAKIDETGQEL